MRAFWSWLVAAFFGLGWIFYTLDRMERAEIDVCESAVHHDARTVGYLCCLETCGDAGVSGFRTTANEHVCACGSER